MSSKGSNRASHIIDPTAPPRPIAAGPVPLIGQKNRELGARAFEDAVREIMQQALAAGFPDSQVALQVINLGLSLYVQGTFDRKMAPMQQALEGIGKALDDLQEQVRKQAKATAPQAPAATPAAAPAT